MLRPTHPPHDPQRAGTRHPHLEQGPERQPHTLIRIETAVQILASLGGDRRNESTAGPLAVKQVEEFDHVDVLSGAENDDDAVTLGADVNVRWSSP